MSSQNHEDTINNPAFVLICHSWIINYGINTHKSIDYHNYHDYNFVAWGPFWIILLEPYSNVIWVRYDNITM